MKTNWRWTEPKDRVDVDDELIIYDEVPCGRCDFESRNIVGYSVSRKHSLVWCGYCGLQEWIPGLPDSVNQRFTEFPYGRFKGKSVESVMATSEGRAYARWAIASNHTFADTLKEYLDSDK